MRPLRRTRIALLTLFPGQVQARFRAAVQRTAESAAAREMGPAEVLDAVVVEHGDDLTFTQICEIGRALRADLPIDDLGSMILRRFELTEARS